MWVHRKEEPMRWRGHGQGEGRNGHAIGGPRLAGATRNSPHFHSYLIGMDTRGEGTYLSNTKFFFSSSFSGLLFLRFVHPSMGRTRRMPTAFCFLSLVILGFISSSSQASTHHQLLETSIVDQINRDPTAGWRATLNPRFSNYTTAQFKRLLGVKKPTPQYHLGSVPILTHPKSLKLPSNFDARTVWSHCTTITTILDQGHCGSCWAFGAVEALSDRFCIHFRMNISLSVNDLLACCGFMCGDGCDGGYPIAAWKYLVRNGVVTNKCDPYFDDIGCSHPGCEPAFPTPKCEKKCKEKNQIWEESKHFSVNAYRISSDPHDIMAEIYKNGPVEVSFTVYEDFAYYKSGVYKHVTGDVMGGHAVKLIGWGTTEEGDDYWLLANQWNRSWGDDGFFKIRRGTNECGIEDDVVAGLPSTKNLIRKYSDGGAESDDI